MRGILGLLLLLLFVSSSCLAPKLGFESADAGASGRGTGTGGDAGAVADSAGSSGAAGDAAGSVAGAAGDTGGTMGDAGASGVDSGGVAGEAGASRGFGGRAGSASGGSAGNGGVGNGGVGNGGVGNGNAGNGNAGNGGAAGGMGVLSPIPTTGLTLWLRADRGAMMNGAFVQEWQDQSSAHFDAIQTAANERPKYLATGFGGLPTLEFDGTDDFLKFGDGFADFSRGLSGFVVAKPNDARCASMLEFSNGSEVDDISLGVWQGQWSYEVAEEDLPRGSVDLEHFSLYAVTQRPVGTVELRANGNGIGSKSFMQPVVKLRQNNFLGRTLYANCAVFSGQISEVILYSRVVTDNELLVIESYLRSHWLLPAAGSL